MSPTQKYFLSIASITAIVTLALVTATLEVFQRLLNLPEETRAVLQSAALTGQVLLLLAQAIEKLHSPYRLTIRNSARLFHHVLFNMADLHLVLPALNLSTLNAGILIMMQQVRLMMFSLNMVDYSMSFLSLYT